MVRPMSATNPNRTEAEQAYWDSVSLAVVAVCAMKAKKAPGCAHYARDMADALLSQRRDSERNDKGSQP